MRIRRCSGVAAFLVGLAVAGQTAAVTIEFSGTVRASCSIAGIENTVPESAPGGHRQMTIGSVAVVSVGKPSLAVNRVIVLDTTGAVHDVPIHSITLRASGRSGASALRGGVPHLKLTRRSQQVAVLIDRQMLDGLSAPYRFEIAALCTD